MRATTSKQLRDRVREKIHDWSVVVMDTLETESSYLAFGRTAGRPVVLKVARDLGDEWRSGEVLEAFDGKGVVRVYERSEGAVLLEWLTPGNSLLSLTLDGRDEEATEILAQVMLKMAPTPQASQFVSAEDWARGFDRYSARGDDQISNELLLEAQEIYSGLCRSQRYLRLLHGDLHHYNVLLDSGRGWVAIDPKGVIGELEFEIGSILRNPVERPDLFASPATIEKRLRHFDRRLKIDFHRALAWAFAQAVLSAIWSIEDGQTVDAAHPAIMLANAIRPMIGAH